MNIHVLEAISRASASLYPGDSPYRYSARRDILTYLYDVIIMFNPWHDK